MRRTSLLMATMLVLGMLAVPAAGAVAQDEQTDEADVAPGERLSGVVGVQEAEFDGEIERGAYEVALERADDNATEASHIAEKLEEAEERLADLEERKAELEEQRESGEITEGKYRAEMAQVATEVDNVEEQLNHSEAAADRLPNETLEANGVNVTAIETLQANADELTGEEVAEIARSIAGDENGEVPEQADEREDADDRDERGDEQTEEQPDDADERGDEQTEEQPDDYDGNETDDGQDAGQ